MTEHTDLHPRPWEFKRAAGLSTSINKANIVRLYMVDAKDKVIETRTFIQGDYTNIKNTKALYRRIVAAVNACAGISTEFLERDNTGVVGVKYTGKLKFSSMPEEFDSDEFNEDAGQ